MRCQYCDYVCANANPDLKLHMKRKHLKNDPDEPPGKMAYSSGTRGLACSTKLTVTSVVIVTTTKPEQQWVH